MSAFVGVALACLSMWAACHSGGSSFAADSLLLAIALSSCLLRMQASGRLWCLPWGHWGHLSGTSGPPIPLRFLHKLVPQVEPQCGVHSHVTLSKSWLCGNHRLLSWIRVAARSLVWQKRPPYRWWVVWSGQYWRSMAIQAHTAGQHTRMSSKWVPMGISGNSPLIGIIVCTNSGVRSHLDTRGTGKGSWSFQCWMSHLMMASILPKNFWALSPNADRHLTASWSGARERQMAMACPRM